MLVILLVPENLTIKSTTVPHRNIHKYTWTSPDGITYNQIDHVLVDKRRQIKLLIETKPIDLIKRRLSSIIDVRSLRGADCDTDHYLMVVTIRERLSLKKGIKQHLVADRYNSNKLVDRETRKEYQIDVANRFAALEGL